MRLFAVLLTACLLIAPVSAQNGPRVPSDFAPRGSGDYGVAGERVEALELRIAQLEQLLEAQRTLQNRNRLSETARLAAALGFTRNAAFIGARRVCRAGIGCRF